MATVADYCKAIVYLYSAVFPDLLNTKTFGYTPGGSNISMLYYVYNLSSRQYKCKLNLCD